MQLHQVETFVRVAECESFSGAARQLYVSSSAVQQQINSLETFIGDKLFERTRHGLTLTDVGKYLLGEGRALLKKNQEIQGNIQRMKYERENCIILGSGIRQNCSIFYSLWGQFIADHDQYQVRTLDISDLTMFIPSTRKPDLIESVRDGETWQQDYSFLYLCKEPIVCAVPKAHPLAGEKRLNYEMMRPYTLVTAPTALNPELDRLSGEAEAAGITVRRAKVYDFSLFTECSINNWMIQIPEAWGYACTDFVMIPCEWEYSHDYGFFYKEPVNKPLEDFLEYVRKQYKGKLLT